MASTYTGTFPSMTVKKTTAEAINDALVWGRVIAGNNTYHYGEYGPKKYATGQYKKIHDVTHSSGCHFCNTNYRKKVAPANKLGFKGENWEKTYVCNTFATAMFAHGAMESTCLALCNKGSCFGMNDAGRSTRLDKSKNWKYMGKLKIADLKPGDVLISSSHAQVVYAKVSSSKVKIIEATSYTGKYGCQASKDSIRIKEKKPSFTSVYRFIGTVNGSFAIKPGEISERVKQMQAFLKWYGIKLDVDGIFFDDTFKAVKEFQKKEGLSVDGYFGPKSLAKAKKVKR